MLRPTRWPAVWGLLLAMLTLQGCRQPADPATALDGPELHVEFTGCKRVRVGPVCVMPEPDSLRLWIRTEPGVELRLNGGPLPAEQVWIDGGTRIELQVTRSDEVLYIESRRAGATTSWRMAIDHTPSPPWYEQALAAWRGGDEAEVRALLEPRAASPHPEVSAPALGFLARLDLTADPLLAERRLREAILANRRVGEFSREIRDGSVLAFLLLEGRRFGEMREVLSQLPNPVGHAQSAFHVAYQRGQHDHRTGDLRNARRELTYCLQLTRHLAMGVLELQATAQLSLTLTSLGLFVEAQDLWRQKRDTLDVGDFLDDTCVIAKSHNNQAWALLLAAEAAEGLHHRLRIAAQSPTHTARELLLETLALFKTDCLEMLGEQSNVRLNLALAELQMGNTAEARHWLDEAASLSDDQRFTGYLWRQDIEARLDLAAGRPQAALERYRTMERQAQKTMAGEARWRALVGRGQVLAQLQRREAALRAFSTADGLLDHELLLVPMHLGREGFLEWRQRATRQHLDLLIQAGKAEEALAVVRRSRSRYLRSLRRFVHLANMPPSQHAHWVRTITEYRASREEVDSAAAQLWQLPSDRLDQALGTQLRNLRELSDQLDRLLHQLGSTYSTSTLREKGVEVFSERKPGELLLAFHPLSDGWAGIASDDRGVIAIELGLFDPGTAEATHLSKLLLSPFSAQIERAHSLRILAPGALRGIDFHALPFPPLTTGSTLGARTLLDEVAVTYGADLPALAAGTRKSQQGILVVGDPTGNLPASRGEALAIAEAWRAEIPREQVQLLLQDQADAMTVRRQLSQSDFFHYAGHAVYDGWHSYLPLASGGRLTLDDLMTLDRAPRQVVLSGCETATGTAAVTLESISLAHAFLVAGSREILATTRPVNDRQATQLVSLMTRNLPRTATLAEAAREAQLALRERVPGADWSAFRVIVP